MPRMSAPIASNKSQPKKTNERLLLYTLQQSDTAAMDHGRYPSSLPLRANAPCTPLLDLRPGVTEPVVLMISRSQVEPHAPEAMRLGLSQLPG